MTGHKRVIEIDLTAMDLLSVQRGAAGNERPVTLEDCVSHMGPGMYAIVTPMAVMSDGKVMIGLSKIVAETGEAV